MKNTRSHLLAQAEQIESRLKRALLKSQQSMSDMMWVWRAFLLSVINLGYAVLLRLLVETIVFK